MLRGKTHSSLGGRKAYLNFELKDAPKARGLRPSQILDFKVQIRSGLPCDEWEAVAGAAYSLTFLPFRMSSISRLIESGIGRKRPFLLR